MTVAENIWLAREPLRNGGLVDAKEIRRRTAELLALFEGTFKAALHPDAAVASLPPDEKQIIEILKAISFDPRLIILDEATASLDRRQVERLFELVNKWKAAGKAIIFVSHRMEEIFRIADKYSVLRNGVTVGAGAIKEINERTLVELMVEKASATRVVQRQRDLLLALFGDLPYRGDVHMSGEAVRFKHPSQAIKKGVALVPGERTKEGLLFIRSILENLLAPSWRNYGFPLRMGRAKT